MDLIERYLHDVGWRLPARQREDIVKELRSLLQDALDARTKGREPTPEDITAVLKEFGSPDMVAARYNGDACLIGPRLYRLYKTVLFIELCVLAFGLAVSVVVGNAFVAAPAGVGSPWSGILQFLGGLIIAGFCATGIVTVVFWGIERCMAYAGRKPGGRVEDWDPRKLPPVPKKRNDWKQADSIVAAVFIVIALIVLNGFPVFVAIYNRVGIQWHSVQVFSNDALAAYLPLWNIGLVCSLVMHMALLVRRRWELATNLANIALQLFGAAVAFAMLLGPSLLNPMDEAKTLLKYVPLFNDFARLAFGIVSAVCLYETGRSVYRIIKGGRIVVTTP